MNHAPVNAERLFIVRRSAKHLWCNTDEKPARIVFVPIEASPFLEDGRPLPEIEP
jgi:hypothetical protein